MSQKCAKNGTVPGIWQQVALLFHGRQRAKIGELTMNTQYLQRSRNTN